MKIMNAQKNISDCIGKHMVNMSKQDIKLKPLVSVVVLVYNHRDFIKDTLDGVFTQEYDNMEIIISDDASPDNSIEVIQEYIANHPCKYPIKLNHNEKNMGLVPHLNYLMDNLVHGDIIVFFTGDDISMPNRVRDVVSLFSTDESIMTVTGQSITIDKAGNEINEDRYRWKAGKYVIDDDYIRSLSFMSGGEAYAFRRKVWDTFGDLRPDCPTEDSTLRFRALLLGGIAVSENIFIKYRVHENNLSGNQNVYKLKTKRIAAQYKQDLCRALELNLISKHTAKRLLKKLRLYSISREIAASKQGKSKLLRAPYKIIQLLVDKIRVHL